MTDAIKKADKKRNVSVYIDSELQSHLEWAQAHTGIRSTADVFRFLLTKFVREQRALTQSPAQERA